MASCHSRKKRCGRDGGEGVSGSREGGAPISPGSAGELLRGSFPPAGPGAPSSAARARADPSGATSVRKPPPQAGVPLPGVPRGLRADEQRGLGPGSRRGAGPGCAEPLVGISRTRAGARGRCVSSRVVRLDDSSSPAPRVAFRGATAGLQRPGPHFMPEKPMRRLKTLCNSSRKILSPDLYLQKA